MKASLASACLLLALFALAAPSSAQATTIVSSVTHNQTLGTVEGYTATQLSYPAAYYYNAVADAHLYDQNWLLRDQRYSEGGPSVSALTATSATPGMSYYLYGDHYAGAYFYYCDYYCTSPQYYDYCGFSQMAGGSYGGYYYFECYYFCYFFYAYVYLGGTFDAVTVPQPCPNLTIELRTLSGSSSIAGARINGTTQTAYLGANVVLQASISPGVSGSYTWSATGPATQEDTGFHDSRNFYWTGEGTYTATVTFIPSDGSCQISASVTVNVVVPRGFTFTATQTSAFIKQGDNCRDDRGVLITGPAFALGCGLQEPGIEFIATVQGPVPFISAASYSQIKFVQWTNPYAIAHMNSGYECATLRPSEHDTINGWFLDGRDPYPGHGGNFYGLPSASFRDDGRTHQLRAVDSPMYPMADFDYFRSHDLFEMTLVYIGGPNVLEPRVQRPIAVIAWHWGGEIFFSSPGNWQSYYSYPPPQWWTGVATNTLRIFSPGSPTNVGFSPCSGQSPGPEPTPDPCYDSGWNCL